MDQKDYSVSIESSKLKCYAGKSFEITHFMYQNIY